MARAVEGMVNNNNASSKELHIFSFDQITFTYTIEFITNLEEHQDYYTTIHYTEQVAWKQTMEE
jgi:hypothetical protein